MCKFVFISIISLHIFVQGALTELACFISATPCTSHWHPLPWNNWGLRALLKGTLMVFVILFPWPCSPFFYKYDSKFYCVFIFTWNFIFTIFCFGVISHNYYFLFYKYFFLEFFFFFFPNEICLYLSLCFNFSSFLVFISTFSSCLFFYCHSSIIIFSSFLSGYCLFFSKHYQRSLIISVF